MNRSGIECPLCSTKKKKPVLTERKWIPAGVELKLDGNMTFAVNHTSEIDFCTKCRGYYPVELKGVVRI